MTRVLAEQGLLRVVADPGGGNRRRLTLTTAGEQVVKRWGGDLEERFAALVDEAGVPYRGYADDTERLLERLEAAEASGNRGRTRR
jgi:DNA-binding PadR family transcriptional regulator